MTYLSFHPEGLKEVFITGGLAPLIDNPDENYEANVGESNVCVILWRRPSLSPMIIERVGEGGGGGGGGVAAMAFRY